MALTRLALFFFLAYATATLQDDWVEDGDDVSGACSVSIDNAPADNKIPKGQMGKCPVCDLDCDTEQALAEGLIDEDLIVDLVEAGHSNVFVYGRVTCGMTSRFMSQLKAKGIKYELKNCDSNEGGREMWAKLQAAGHSGGVGLPVVDMYGTTKVRPTVADVEAAAGGNNGSGNTKPAPKPTPNPACADKRSQCAEWHTRGLCKGKYESFMKINCCKTCSGSSPAASKPKSTENTAAANGLVVYGRETCGMAQHMKSQLDGAGDLHVRFRACFVYLSGYAERCIVCRYRIQIRQC